MGGNECILLLEGCEPLRPRADCDRQLLREPRGALPPGICTTVPSFPLEWARFSEQNAVQAVRCQL